MSRKNKSNLPHSKVPLAQKLPPQTKDPRASEAPNDKCFPEFRATQMDIDGPYGWHKFNLLEIPEILQKIFEAQRMTWQEHYAHGSHLVKVSKIIPKMQKRLKELKQEDLDVLYSLRLSGKMRVWGIKEANLFWLLWWDPDHEICPSFLKNT